MTFVADAETAVLAAAKDMLRRGLVEGTAGNISARREDGNLVITPSSVDYADMTLADLVVVDPDGTVRARRRRPIALDGDEAAPGLLCGIRRHRQRHPQSPGVGHHVRDRPSADSRVYRRIRHLLRRRHPLQRIRGVGHTRGGQQRGEGVGRPRRGADRQPRAGGGRAPTGQSRCTSPPSSSGQPKSPGVQLLSAGRCRFPKT